MKKLIIVVVLSGVVFLATGQKADYTEITYDKSDGLGQNYIYSLLQDNKGYLWIGTGAGLSSYDGKSIVNYTSEDSLRNEFITSATLDEVGNVFLGHFDGGVTLYDGFKFKAIPLDSVDRKIVAFSYNEASKETIGISQSGQLVIIDRSLKTKVIAPEILNFKVVNSLERIDDNIYVGTNEGLVVFVIENGVLDEGKLIAELEYINVTALLAGQDRSLWVGTEDEGVFKLSHDSTLLIQKQFDSWLDQMNVSALAFDSSENLWIGTTRDGMMKVALASEFGEQSAEIFNSTNGYADNIQTIFIDREASIWVGTIGQGLVQIIRNKFGQYNLLDSFPESELIAGLKPKAMDYLFFTNHGVITAKKSESGSDLLIDYQGITELNDLAVRFAFEDPKNRLWLNTVEGELFLFDIISNELIGVNIIDESTTVHTMFADSRSNIWISVAGYGLLMLDSNDSVTNVLNTTTGFFHNDVFAIYEDKDENMWFGAKGAGLALMRSNGDIDYLSQRDIFPSRDINAIVGDKSGNIWIATDGDGVFKYNGTEFVRMSRENGLQSNYCNRLLVDNFNDLWVVHISGLSKITIENNKIEVFGPADGVDELEVAKNLFFHDEQGGVWFGTKSNMVRYNSYVANEVKMTLTPYITKVRFNYLEEDLAQYSIPENEKKDFVSLHLTFPHNKNHLTFDYIAVQLAKRNSIFYKHQLVGFDKTWSPPTTATSSTYTNLLPGQYVLKLAASDNLNSWIYPEVSMSFSIQKPYWEEAWFYILQVGIIVTLFTVTYNLSKYSANKKKDLFILRLMVYVILFIIFEYAQTFIDPYTESLGGAPTFKIGINLMLALILFPVESLIKKFFKGA